MSERNAFLDAVARQALERPDTIAFLNAEGESLTYAELAAASDELACLIHERVHTDEPIMVYGHKSPLMVVSFLACLKSGHAYVPTDWHVPAGRVANILSQLPATCVVCVEGLPESVRSGIQGTWCIGRPELGGVLRLAGEGSVHGPDPSWSVTGDSTQYVIFTSGSTGAPKGVEVTADDVANFMPWDQSMFADAPSPRVFVNQALLSFDLSVTEFVAALTTGGTIFSLSQSCEDDLEACFRALAHSDATCWVSTPTFATMCLADPSFSQELLPRLTHLFFCGEPLRPDVVDRLARRFPSAKLINAYGPTESTVAVTSMTMEAGRFEGTLPVGYAKPGTTVRVRDRATGEWLAPGSEGELVICGDTVAKGYLGQPAKTAEVFGVGEFDGVRARTYRTGDLGRVDANGLVWCSGRIDSQVKLHGYRIELGEVEAALQGMDGVELAVVVVRSRHGVPSSLEAHVQLEGSAPEDAYEWSRSMREDLARILPDYMVPRRIVVDEELPVTPNGKVDRRGILQGASRS